MEKDGIVEKKVVIFFFHEFRQKTHENVGKQQMQNGWPKRSMRLRGQCGRYITECILQGERKF